MENKIIKCFKVTYTDVDKYDQVFTNDRTFSSLKKARQFAQKMFTGYDPIEIRQVTETVLERFEPTC